MTLNTGSSFSIIIFEKVYRQEDKENTIGFCAKCGSPITYGCKFCASCGTPVPESMIAEAEAARKAAEETEPVFCQNCGAILEDGALFCASCGAKME